MSSFCKSQRFENGTDPLESQSGRSLALMLTPCSRVSYALDDEVDVKSRYFSDFTVALMGGGRMETACNPYEDGAT
jgi:hypothetical protein